MHHYEYVVQCTASSLEKIDFGLHLLLPAAPCQSMLHTLNTFPDLIFLITPLAFDASGWKCFLLLLAISHQVHSVFCLSVHASVCVYDHILKVCEHDMLQTACENFTKFTTVVQVGKKMN